MDCIDILKQGVGRDLSDDDLVDVMAKVKIERRRLQLQDEPDVRGALKASMQAGIDKQRMEMLAKKRATMLDFARFTENMDFILNEFKDRPRDGLDALISGSSLVRKGARDSVEARQNSLAGYYVQGFGADVEKLGLVKLLNSGEMDKDIARALFALSEIEAGNKVFEGAPEALEIAKVMRKWQDKAVDAANDAGAFIAKRSDYIVRQSHERARIRKAGFDKWKEAILPELDLDKTLDPDGLARKSIGQELVNKQGRLQELEELLQSLKLDRKAVFADLELIKGKKAKALRSSINARLAEIKSFKLDAALEFKALRGEVKELLHIEKSFKAGQADADRFLYYAWQGLSSGEHLKYGAPVHSGGGKKVHGSAAKRLSHERVLHFKDADGWIRYNEQFGSGNLREAFMNGLDRQARGTAMMQVLGPSGSNNWEAMLDALKKHFVSTHQQTNLDQLQNRHGEIVLRNRLKEVDGSLNVAGSDTLATAGMVMRGVQGMAKLGGVLLSSITDMSSFGTEMAHQGYGFFEPIMQGLKGLGAGKSSGERLAVLSEIGVAMEGMIGSLAGKFAGDELPGRMSNWMRTYFKLNGLTWWTDAWRQSAGLMMSHGLAVRKAMSFLELPPEMSRTLSLYGIDEGKWDIMRQANLSAADGREYLTPEGIRQLSQEVFVPYLEAKGIKPTALRVKKLQDELASQYLAYFKDRVDYAVLQPDSKTRATLRQGTSAGTVQGEALRFVTQFKAFPTAVFQRTWGREIYGRGADSIGEALKNGHGELRGMARVFLTTTLFGYASMTIKDMLRGYKPRPLDAEHWHKTVTAAMLQGGALGVYGDFLFSEMRKSRGGGVISTLAGPTASSIDQIADIWGRVSEGDSAAAASLRVVLNHIPGNNLFYVRPVFDHAIGYEMFEMMSPGYMRRTVNRAKKEHGREFWLKPGQASIIKR